MLKIQLYDDAKDFLDSLSVKRRQQVAKKIIVLASGEMEVKSKLLVGFEPLKRFRSGDYRIVYFETNDTLNVVFIDNRNDDKIYRRLLRKLH